MPGKHSAKQKRQAKHIAASERARGKSPEEAERIGWATVNKAGEAYLPRPKTEWATPRETMSRMSYGARKKHPGGSIRRIRDGIKDLGTHTVTNPDAKSFRVVSLNDYYDAVTKADGQPAAPAAQGSGPPKKFPRRDKTPNVLGKPTAKALSNPYASLIGPEAVAAGEKKDKEIDERSRTRDRAWIAANPKPKTKKALSTGYGKVSGGGALKAPNRGFPVKKGPGDFKPTPIAARTSQASQRSSAPKKPGLEIGEVTVTPMPKKPVNLEIGDVKVTPMPKKPVNLEIGPATVTSLGSPKPTQVAARKALRLSINDLNRAVTAQPSASPPPVPGSSKRPYLPGVHPVSAKPKFKRDAGSFMGMPAKKPGKSLDAQRPKTSSKKSPRVLDDGGAALMSSMPPPTLKKPNTVVQKSKGTSMSKTNFNNLFKSELGIPNDEVLCDCPHCDAPITKSDLASQNKGDTMRGGEGRGTISPSRGVAGAKQTDEVRMVGDKSKKKMVSKAHDDSSDVEKGRQVVNEPAAPKPTQVAQKGDGVDRDPGGQPINPRNLNPAGATPEAKKMRAAQNPTPQQVAAWEASGKPGGKPYTPPVPAGWKVPQAAPHVASKGMQTVRGTEFVQYVDYAGAPGSDAAIAKSIAEGAIGQQPTQPMDLNNDLSRLLV